MEVHPKLQELENEWGNMLSHQVPMLPPREQFWDQLPSVLTWLYGVNNKL